MDPMGNFYNLFQPATYTHGQKYHRSYKSTIATEDIFKKGDLHWIWAIVAPQNQGFWTIHLICSCGIFPANKRQSWYTREIAKKYLVLEMSRWKWVVLVGATEWPQWPGSKRISGIKSLWWNLNLLYNFKLKPLYSKHRSVCVLICWAFFSV